jgi:hypothetical protein
MKVANQKLLGSWRQQFLCQNLQGIKAIVEAEPLKIIVSA